MTKLCKFVFVILLILVGFSLLEVEDEFYRNSIILVSLIISNIIGFIEGMNTGFDIFTRKSE